MKNKYDGQLVLYNNITDFEYVTDKDVEIDFLESFLNNYTEEFVSYISRPNKSVKLNKKDTMLSWIGVAEKYNKVVEYYYPDNQILLVDIKKMSKSENNFLLQAVIILDNMLELFNIDLYDVVSDNYKVLTSWSSENLEGKLVLSILEAENLIREKLGLDVIIDNSLE